MTLADAPPARGAARSERAASGRAHRVLAIRVHELEAGDGGRSLTASCRTRRRVYRGGRRHFAPASSTVSAVAPDGGRYL